MVVFRSVLFYFEKTRKEVIVLNFFIEVAVSKNPLKKIQMLLVDFWEYRKMFKGRREEGSWEWFYKYSTIKRALKEEKDGRLKKSMSKHLLSHIEKGINSGFVMEPVFLFLLLYNGNYEI